MLLEVAVLEFTVGCFAEVVRLLPAMLVTCPATRRFLLGACYLSLSVLADSGGDDPFGGASLAGAVGLGGVPRVLVCSCSR